MHFYSTTQIQTITRISIKLQKTQYEILNLNLNFTIERDQRTIIKFDKLDYRYLSGTTQKLLNATSQSTTLGIVRKHFYDLKQKSKMPIQVLKKFNPN